ncbi:MAG: hypothetical protein NT02SARS_1700 [SAR86 cluster bacterium SAR86B]|uniref:Uncharacterized protein n=1 Tax=SAR86 cluster bacterium SAR86B TaxID=1123867 RepID=J5KAP6_9GAMM|nr:MAG: hypothetical protein NT02SARS_1700 [SAR86 cluster bacterium SAR86B]
MEWVNHVLLYTQEEGYQENLLPIYLIQQFYFLDLDNLI